MLFFSPRTHIVPYCFHYVETKLRKKKVSFRFNVIYLHMNFRLKIKHLEKKLKLAAKKQQQNNHNSAFFRPQNTKSTKRNEARAVAGR